MRRNYVLHFSSTWCSISNAVPTASGLATGLGVNAVELVTVIVIGGTVSGFTPISTTGALIMAGVAQQENAEEKFPQNRLFVELFAVSFIALVVLALFAVFEYMVCLYKQGERK